MKLLHLEADFSQTIAEFLIGACRPHGQHTSGPQCGEGRFQACSAVEPIVPIPGQSFGTIVDVEQDGIPGTLLRTQYHGNIDFAHCDPVVPERMAGKVPQGTAVPRHHFRYQLGHDHPGFSMQRMQRGSESVPHTQSADENPWSWTIRYLCTGKRPKGIFRPMHAAVHEFTATDPDREFIVPTV
jgi:hypothetical protein